MEGGRRVVGAEEGGGREEGKLGDREGKEEVLQKDCLPGIC